MKYFPLIPQKIMKSLARKILQIQIFMRASLYSSEVFVIRVDLSTNKERIMALLIWDICFLLCKIILLYNSNFIWQLAVEYESNALIVKVDTDDEYEFARDMQVQPTQNLFYFNTNTNYEEKYVFSPPSL